MTRTEERLQDALHASAGRVRDDRLHPFHELAPSAEPRMNRRQPRWPGAEAWRPWLIPAAAAASVMLVIGLVMVVTGGLRHPASAVSGVRPAAQSAAGPPKYYAEVEGKLYGWSGRDSVEVVVRSTASGAVVARVPTPVIAGVPKARPISVAAAPDDRTFYAVYENWGGKPGDCWIYRFGVTPSGQVTALARISGAPITGQSDIGNVAGFDVSPDGSQLALAAAGVDSDTTVASAVASEIVVINLRTGAHTIWRGGLNRIGQIFGIENLSWAAGGKSLVFLAKWCPPVDIGYGPYGGFVCATVSSPRQGPQPEGSEEVRLVHVTAAGGALSSSSLLQQASAKLQPDMPVIADPAAPDLITVIHSGDDSYQVVKLSAATGAVTSVLGQVAGGSAYDFYLVADLTGSSVLIWMAGNAPDPVHGWVHDGSYHQLAPTFPLPSASAVQSASNWIQLTW